MTAKKLVSVISMPSPIDFYFDFSSPYGYLAAEMIEALGQRCGRPVNWHPMLLGVVFKTTGGQPLTMAPMKGPYSERDMRRSAAFYGVPFNMPSVFPIATQTPHGPRCGCSKTIQRTQRNSRSNCSALSSVAIATSANCM
jgi:2-hydroxychromene-2-carboxylate isomerase